MTSYGDGDAALAPRGSLCNNSLLSHTTGVSHMTGGGGVSHMTGGVSHAMGGQSHTSSRVTTGSGRAAASRKASCSGATTALIEYN